MLDSEKYQVVPMGSDPSSILTILKIIRVKADEDEDENLFGDDSQLEAGVYCFDSAGQFWKLCGPMTDMIALLDLKDPQLKKDRVEARERLREKTKKKRKRKDA